MFVVCRLVRIAAKFLLKFQVTGTEKIPREYPFILCANHASYLDALLIAAAVPFPAFRRMFFIGGKKYFRNPLQRWFGRRLHALPIDAASHAAATLRLAAEGLKEGYVLCVFPEGHRSIDGTLLPFQKGPSILAIEAGVPIVPLGIVGTQKVWGRGSRRLRLSPVQLRFGAPIYWYSRETGQTNYEGLTTHLQAVIAELIRAPGAG
jgi:1-acyl-sn-glycerol-3-phosphate acyltransferase